MEMENLLTKLCTAVGTPGHEGDAAGIAGQLLEPLGEVETTVLGSVICKVKPWIEGRKTILLEAHLDQVGLIVSTICDEGFIRVGSCGGIDSRMLPGCAFKIHTESGIIPAIGVSVPPHLQRAEDKDKPLKIEDMLIDTSLSAEKAKEMITPGDVITFDSPVAKLAGSLITGPALDNRAGCAAVITAGNLLGGRDYGINVALMLSSMEEVGGQGALTGAYSLIPNYSIAVDVTYGYAPGLPEDKCFKLGSGAIIGIAPILNRSMTEALTKTAKEKDIPFGYEVMGGRTGTNADEIAVARCGVPTALISIPLRNMHTPSEIVDTKDIEAVAKLMADYIKEGALC